jgi:hypothetical protein
MLSKLTNEAVTKICASCTDLGGHLDQKKFSHVVCSLTLMWVEDVHSALTEMKKALELDGVVILAVWGALEKCLAAQSLQKVAGTLHPLNWRFGDLEFFSRTVEEAGLEVIKAEEVQVRPSTTDIHESWVKAAEMLGNVIHSEGQPPQESYFMTVNIITARTPKPQ